MVIILSARRRCGNQPSSSSESNRAGSQTASDHVRRTAEVSQIVRNLKLVPQMARPPVSFGDSNRTNWVSRLRNQRQSQGLIGFCSALEDLPKECSMTAICTAYRPSPGAVPKGVLQSARRVPCSCVLASPGRTLWRAKRFRKSLTSSSE